MSMQERHTDRYDDFYRSFDTPLMRRIRKEAYGEDIGQHSWVSADDLRADIARLRLSVDTRFLDVGCGPCGPLTFVLAQTGCAATGLDRNTTAIEVGRARASELGVHAQLMLREADLEQMLPLESASFDAAMALDVVIHLEDRSRLYREVARVLAPRGRFLATDAGIVTGAITDAELQARSLNGQARLVPPGTNESALEAAGFRVVEVEDRSASIVRNASGRKTAIEAHRAELEPVMGVDELQQQLQYLDVVVELAQRGAVSRMMYLAEIRP